MPWDWLLLVRIADVVPLLGENRILTKYGLSALQYTEIPGLRALLDIADLSNTNLDAFHVGYRLGPRLNAPGRVGNAGIVVEMLTTTCREGCGNCKLSGQ